MILSFLNFHFYVLPTLTFLNLVPAYLPPPPSFYDHLPRGSVKRKILLLIIIDAFYILITVAQFKYQYQNHTPVQECVAQVLLSVAKAPILRYV